MADIGSIGQQPIGSTLSDFFAKIQFGISTSVIATILESIILGGFVLWAAWYFGFYKRQWNVDVIILAKRGEMNVAAVGFDKGKSIRKYNEMKFKLMKNKSAKVDIPNYDFVRMSESGRKVLFLWKDTEDSYHAVDPNIITEKEIDVFVKDAQGKETGQKVKIKKALFEPKESVSDQLLVLDLREIISLYDKKTGLDKYGYLVAIIIIGLIFVASLWIFSKNMVTAAQIIATSNEKLAEKLVNVASIVQR